MIDGTMTPFDHDPEDALAPQDSSTNDVAAENSIEPADDAAEEEAVPETALTGDTPVQRERHIAPREYYSISEVCDLVGLKPHVLRYWETQFPVLNPSKNRSGNRVYQRKEIKLILLVKHLLYKEKYTIDGAKQRLEQLRRGGEMPAETARALDSQMVELLRAELQQVLQLLTIAPA